MPGKDLSADDIGDIWRAGAVYMQEIGNQYGRSASSLHSTALSEGSAFEGANGELAANFSQLRNLLQDRILVQSWENFSTAGDTIASFALEIVGLDSENGSSVDDRAADLQEIMPGARPPSIPDPPSSGDDHPPHPDEPLDPHGPH